MRDAPKFSLVLLAAALGLAETRAELPELAGAATVAPAGIESFRQVVGNAGMSRRARFSFGKIQFNTEWDPAPGQVPANDGLGPVFNAIACAACHINNGRGAPPATKDEEFDALLVRLSISGTGPQGQPLPVPGYGDQLQHRGIEGVPGEGNARLIYETINGQYADGTEYQLRKPVLEIYDLAFGQLPDETMYSLRIANPVMGLGLLEAVPESALLELADPTDENKDGISGRINCVWSPTENAMAVGRFGWKANVANIAEQNAGAALGDMGITTTLLAKDNCEPEQRACREASELHTEEIEFQDDFFKELTRYVRLLGVPRQRGSDSADVQAGNRLFTQLGCTGCHAPTLVTGENASFTELAEQTIHPYTDLLLHDMGPGLADGRPDFEATGSEWRTAPLWGIGLTADVGGFESYLHDGRARSLSEAILWHGGEAKNTRNAFAALPIADREQLLRFLKSL